MIAYRWSSLMQTAILRVADGSCFPVDASNPDYLKFLESGEEIGAWRPFSTLEQARAYLTALAQQEAERRVAAVVPPDRQAQQMALSLRILSVQAERALTLDEETTRLGLKAASDAIYAVRAAEAQHQIAIAALADLAAVEAYDVTTGWPE